MSGAVKYSFTKQKEIYSSKDKLNCNYLNQSFESNDTIENESDHLELYFYYKRHTSNIRDEFIKIDFNENETNRGTSYSSKNYYSLIDVDGLLIQTYSNIENFEILETLKDFKFEEFFIKLIPLHLPNSSKKLNESTDSQDDENTICIKIYDEEEFKKSLIFKSFEIQQINFYKINSKQQQKIMYLSGSWFFIR